MTFFVLTLDALTYLAVKLAMPEGESEQVFEKRIPGESVFVTRPKFLS